MEKNILVRSYDTFLAECNISQSLQQIVFPKSLAPYTYVSLISVVSWMALREAVDRIF